MSLLKDLATIIDDGWKIHISNETRRMEVRGVRDFYFRSTWKAERGEKRKECRWKGFDSSESAIKDMIKKLKPKR